MDELEDLLGTVMTASGQEVVVCGDMNCHGSSPTTVDDRLSAVFYSLNLSQLVRTQTRGNNILDVLACTEDRHLVHDVHVDDAGCVSDHRLVAARLAMSWMRWSPVSYK